jgi:hypothetical protein
LVILYAGVTAVEEVGEILVEAMLAVVVLVDFLAVEEERGGVRQRAERVVTAARAALVKSLFTLGSTVTIWPS